MSAEPIYAVCKCGCVRFSSWLEIVSKGKAVTFEDVWRCDDCGAVLKGASRKSGDA